MNWVVPAAIMSAFLPKGTPEVATEAVSVKRGGFVVLWSFPGNHRYGGALPQSFTFTLHGRHDDRHGITETLWLFPQKSRIMPQIQALGKKPRRLRDNPNLQRPAPLTSFISCREPNGTHSCFFYGVVLCVGGLSALGYLNPRLSPHV